MPRLPDTGQRWYVEAMPRKPSDLEPPFGERLMEQASALYNFARYLSRDSVAAEELVQDAFARALDAQARFVPGSNLKAWLFRILRNAFLDAKRRDRRNPVSLRESDDSQDENDASDAWLRGDIELDRLRNLVAQDIEAALGRLSDEARSVILLDLEGFTETEIASVMDTAVGTVKSRLARARAVLREELREYAK
ncbi:MAG TPA: sigma-70 family RNA polymerase sigma factor [Polyangiaceae bacterium]|nr:sigma-70 family RNA polymerase sigma factor [Polyangiaceae bacterium]